VRFSNAPTAEFGPVDILVNNAGSLVERQRLAQITEERWDDIMNLNLKSAMLFSQMVAPSMIERKRARLSTLFRSQDAMAAGRAPWLTRRPRAL
jgi:NADP-dependent 3-hydroxy acid dehydrogenase YdfG